MMTLNLIPYLLYILINIRIIPLGALKSIFYKLRRHESISLPFWQVIPAILTFHLELLTLENE